MTLFLGSLKKRFPILDENVSALRTKLKTSQKIIRACGALHNVAVLLSDPEPSEQDGAGAMAVQERQDEEEEVRELGEARAKALGERKRDKIAEEYF